MVRILTESTSIAEVAQNLRVRSRILSESMAISEIQVRLTNLLRTISNSIGIAEAEFDQKGFVRIITESVAVLHFTGKILREGFVRIRKIARLFGRGKSVKTYKRGHSIKGADR